MLRLIARTGLREIFTAFALVIVIVIVIGIGIGLLMHWVGLSMALGSFLAGVLLVDSEYRHALESDLEPFKGMLLGIFFSAVGMLVDIGLLAVRSGTVFGLVLLFLVIKLAALYALGRWIGIPASQQVLVVAFSMVSASMLLLLHDTRIAPRYHLPQREEEQFAPQDNPAIIAGFGCFGQIVARLVDANGIKATVLDHDPDQVELLRRFGFTVFFGDATRLDLLQTAGVARVRALVVAIDGIDESLKMVEVVKEAFPDLPIFARARDVSHYYDLKGRGVQIIERETFESALQIGRSLLEHLGLSPYHAHQSTMKFRALNLHSLEALYPHSRNREQFVSMERQARDREDIERVARSKW